ncbi:MAG: YihA family ribosome biogenesis GTP-binding protein [Synergistales bacterium]|nr:YihA family ribosome biogenesis GTP-binding protein [Synergistales bacterium]
MNVAWQAQLMATAFGSAQFPLHDLPEIAVAGRSNVGKSSLINILVNRKIAHVAAKPGKTRSINFYHVNCKSPFVLVDLPGYGYAARSKSERSQWAKLIEKYLENRNQLALVISLIDFRHGLLENDRLLQEWISSKGIPMQVVFTKVDKISRGRRKALLHKYILQGLKSLDVPFLTSATTRDGTDKLQKFMGSYLDCYYGDAGISNELV